jgi:hypothetical protein
MKHLRSLGAWAFACVALAFAAPAQADNQTSKNASGSNFTFCTKTVSAVEHPCHVMEGYDGSAYRIMSVDSSGRPNVNINGTVGLTSNYAEDSAHVTADVGTFSLSVRKDTASALAGTDGDYQPFLTDGSGRLWVNCGSGCSGGTQYNEDAVHASGDTGTMALTVRKDSAAATAGTDGDYQPPITDALGRLWVNCGTGCSGGTQFAEDAASGNGDVGTLAMARRTATPANTSGADLDYETLQMNAGRLWTSATIDTALPAGTATLGGTFGFAGTCTITITRPSDTAVYAANDTLSTSTSAPTTGGETCTSAARISGGSGIITGATIIGSVDASTDLQGEVVIYDSAVTAINDNAAFSPSDADAVKQVCRIGFTLATGDTNNSVFQGDGLNCPFTAVGTANLRALVKVLNAYTPTSAEVLTIRLKFIQTN